MNCTDVWKYRLALIRKPKSPAENAVKWEPCPTPIRKLFRKDVKSGKWPTLVATMVTSSTTALAQGWYDRWGVLDLGAVDPFYCNKLGDIRPSFGSQSYRLLLLYNRSEKSQRKMPRMAIYSYWMNHSRMSGNELDSTVSTYVDRFSASQSNENMKVTKVHIKKKEKKKKTNRESRKGMKDIACSFQSHERYRKLKEQRWWRRWQVQMCPQPVPSTGIVSMVFLSLSLSLSPLPLLPHHHLFSCDLVLSETDKKNMYISRR